MICRQSFLKGLDEMKLANDKRTILAFLNVSDEDEYFNKSTPNDADGGDGDDDGRHRRESDSSKLEVTIFEESGEEIVADKGGSRVRTRKCRRIHFPPPLFSI
jgi:hypothetical protein